MALPRKMGDFLLFKEVGHGNFGRVSQAVRWHDAVKSGLIVGLAALELCRHQQDERDKLVASLQNAELELFAVKLATVGHGADLELERKNCERIRAAKLCHQHPNLMQFVQSTDDEDVKTGAKQLALVFSWCNNGDLRKLLNERKAQSPRAFLTKTEALALAVQLTSAVNTLHKHGLVHRDLAPRNVLVHRENGVLQLKLADFGLCKHILDETTGNSITKDSMGNPDDAASGCRLSAPGDQKQLYLRKDVFGLAMTLFSVVSLEDFSNLTHLEHETARADVRNRLQAGELVTRFGKQFCDILFAMLNEDPATRITADAALSRFSAVLGATEQDLSPSLPSQPIVACNSDKADSKKPDKLPAFRNVEADLFGDFLVRKLQTDFVGRKEMFETISKWLQEKTSKRVLLITGDPGVGKSALVVALCDRNKLHEMNAVPLAYHICSASDGETLLVGKFIRNMSLMCVKKLPEYAKLLDQTPGLSAMLEARYCEQNPIRAFTAAVLKPLCQFNPQTQTMDHAADKKHGAPSASSSTAPVHCFVIDSLDESLRTSGASIVELLGHPDVVQAFPSWLRVIATSRRDAHVLSRFRFPELLETRLSAHSDEAREDVKTFALQQIERAEDLKQLAIVSQPSEQKSQSAVLWAATRVAAVADGNFVVAVQQLRSLAAGEVSFNNLPTVPTGLSQIYARSFNAQFGSPDDPNWKLAQAAFELLQAFTVSRNKSNISALTEALQITSEEKLDKTAAARCWARLSSLLAKTDQELLISPHYSLPEWLQSSENCDYSIDTHRGRRKFFAWRLLRLAEAATNRRSVKVAGCLTGMATALLGHQPFTSVNWLPFAGNVVYDSIRMLPELLLLRCDLAPLLIALKAEYPESAVHAMNDEFINYCSEANRELIELFVTVGGKDLDLNFHDTYCNSPLICAARSGQEDVVRRLLELKAEVNFGLDWGPEPHTALLEAQNRGFLNIAEILVAAGANPSLARLES